MNGANPVCFTQVSNSDSLVITLFEQRSLCMLYNCLLNFSIYMSRVQQIERKEIIHFGVFG